MASGGRSAESQQEGVMLAAGVRSRRAPTETCHHCAQLGVWWSVSGSRPAPGCLARRYALSGMGLCWRTELGADPRPQPNPCSRMPCWVPPSLGGLHAAGSHLMPAGVPRSLRSPGTGEPVMGPPTPSLAPRRPSPRRSATVSRADLRPTATAPCPEVFGAGVCESSDSPRSIGSFLAALRAVGGVFSFCSYQIKAMRGMQPKTALY